MSRYILIRRLRGPAFLLLVGVNALLAQEGILGWGQSWPFYLILAGLLTLAERAALSSEGGQPCSWMPGMGPGPGAGQESRQSPRASADGGSLRVTPTNASPGSASVGPSSWQELENRKEGGQS
jgi:hypothetical protein